MKPLHWFLALTPLLAQNAGPVRTEYLTESGDPLDDLQFSWDTKFFYQLSVGPNGVKTLSFSVYNCSPELIDYDLA